MSDSPVPPASRRWGPRIVIVLIATVAIPVGTTVLYHYAPTDKANSFYPGCTFHYVTGLHCPGCGATRCCHALVHGDLEQAFAWNPMLVLCLPLIVVGLTGMAFTAWTGRHPPGPCLPARTGYVLLVLVVAFWIARNIPLDPVNPLAPHPLRPSDPPAPPQFPMP